MLFIHWKSSAASLVELLVLQKQNGNFIDIVTQFIVLPVIVHVMNEEI